MKKNSQILLRCLLVVCGMAFTNAYAQTYKNGTWYSLYDEGEHSMSTISNYSTGGIFAPTANQLQFKWKYSKVDLLGWFPSNNTKIYESANDGSNTNQVGSLTNQAWDTEHNENLSISTNINWLKWDRATGNTHKVTIYDLKIPLARHILLSDGEYGTTAQSHDFGELDALSSSEAYTITLRSFLSVGDITVHSSDPNNFRLGSTDNTGDLTFAVGSNACASANGTADAAGGGSLGRIDNYAVAVYFTPQEGKSYNAEITISDGVSTATVSVSGIGRKRHQTITWEPETPMLSDATIPAAVASSGLKVSYSFDREGILAEENGALTIVSEGTVTVTASQPGNTVYEAAEPIDRTITIFPAVTRSNYSAAICEGESYSDERFEGLTEQGKYYDTIPNVYGGDSIICLTLTVNPVYRIEDTLAVYEGEAGTWEGIDLSVLPVGDTTLIVRYATVTGCDSARILHLKVLRYTYGAYQASFCEGDSIEFAGKWYSTATEEQVTVPEKNIYGGDSIVTFTTVILPNYLLTETAIIHMDDSLIWREREYGLFVPGHYTFYDSLVSADGCDSVYALELTVNAIPYLFQEVATACQNEEREWQGKVLPTGQAGTFIVYDSLLSQYGMDSVYQLTLTVNPVYRIEDTLAVYEGEAGTWQGIDLSVMPVGDTTLIVRYETVTGCDSVHALLLTVNKAPTTYGYDTIYICGRGEVAYYDNVPYTKPSKTPFSVTLSTPNRFGGDSIVELWVLASHKYNMSFSKVIDQGAEEEWQGIDLSVLPVGDTTLVAEYISVHGCDSVYTLHLTIVGKTATGIDETYTTRPVQKQVRHGQLFIRKGDDYYDIYGRKVRP